MGIPTSEINDSRLAFNSSGFHLRIIQDAECSDSGLRFSSILFLQ